MMQMMQMMKGKGKGWGKRGGGLSSFPPERKVWIGGLPEEEGAVTYEELKEHFPGCKFAAVMKGKSAGSGGVAFETAEEAANAIQTLNGSEFKGAKIVVDVWTKLEKTEAPAEGAEPA